jgi:hypothetical protein
LARFDHQIGRQPDTVVSHHQGMSVPEGLEFNAPVLPPSGRRASDVPLAHCDQAQGAARSGQLHISIRIANSTRAVFMP